VIVWQDLLAARLLQAAITRGIAVPSALSILSCANYEVAELTVPPLTSIEQFPEEIGRQAVALLLRRLDADDHSCGETVIVPPQLVVRDSCAPPHRATPVVSRRITSG
jgi:DNA-binding LacI/PurR family transcriptional regulator